MPPSEKEDGCLTSQSDCCIVKKEEKRWIYYAAWVNFHYAVLMGVRLSMVSEGETKRLSG